ncbi:hypothetical protein MKX01_030690 [Papaver californicum]|nr:hypothetical protein MKX01_030690 [Papaver californicum]
MVAELSYPDLVDPIDFTTVLNLLPRTFKGLKNSSNTNQDDMELIKNRHGSVAIKSSETFMEQARTIVNRNFEHVNNELPCPIQSDNKEEDIVAERDKGREKERRRGLLGHQRRPKFSLKPNAMSQTSLNLEDMEKEIEKIEDPDEFFKAHERLENAKKEIQRQTGGVPTNSTKDDISTTTRVRRPGLEGRAVGHKHRYSLVGAGSNEVFSSQIETDFSSQSMDKPTTRTMDQYDPTEESISMDVGLEKDSVSAAQSNVDRLLHELLSPACTALDGDGALPFLQERLQIKPIHVDKLSLPDLDSFRSINVMAPAERADKSRESLSEMGSLIRQSRNKTSTEIHLSTNTSMYQRVSPTSPESPFASVSLLKKRLSLKGQTARNPFSFSGLDYSPVRSTSLIKGKDIQDLSPDVECDHNNEANDTTAKAPDKKASSAACKFQSAMLVNDDTAGTNMVSKKLSMETVVCSANRSMGADGPSGVLQDKVEDVCHETATSQPKETDLEGLWNTDYSGSLLDGVNFIAGEHRPGDGDSQTANILPTQNSEVEDMRPNGDTSEQKEPGFEDLPSGDIDCSPSHMDESVSAKGKPQTGDVFSQNPDILTEQHDETFPEPSLIESRKRKAPPENRTERQESCRKRLPGAGTQGESDVRRSTRPRTRPLEYWKGEQFLDGRVQNESVSATGKLQTGDVLSENSGILTEQRDETLAKPSLNENKKKKASPQNKMERQITRRKSLAGAGTKWESGVRRSTRHRVRPLEYWKGERLLYGRVHESLLTVIGVKYESPPKSKNEKPAFRVKSYVSDEYKELVENAALH